jgi:anti-sigma factor RsiW
MAPPNGGHLTEEQIEGYAAGSFSDDEAARMEEHLLVCEACRAAVEETAEYVTAMRDAAGQARREQARARRVRPVWAVLAAAALLLGAGAVLRWARSRPSASGIVVRLEAMPGALAAKAPAGKSLEIRPDTSGLAIPPPYRLEIVTDAGRRVWSGAAGVRVPPLAPGVYFARVYSTSGSLLREYGLEVEAPRP